MLSSQEETAADLLYWLFKKRLSLRDVNLSLGELVLEECSDAMKDVLARRVREGRSRYVKVLAEDPNGGLYDLEFMNYAGGFHVLEGDWDLIVAGNELQIGDFVEGWGNLVCNDGGGQNYFTCELYFLRQDQEDSNSGDRDSPLSGNQFLEHKRKTRAKGDGVKNPKKKDNPAERRSVRKYSPWSEKSKTVGGNERNRLNSSPAIQESEQVDVEDIDDGENPEMKEGLTNPRERKKAVSPFEKELDYADIEHVIKQCTGTLKVLNYFLRKLVKNNDEKNFDEEMKVAMDEVMKIIAEIKGRMEERV